MHSGKEAMKITAEQLEAELIAAANAVTTDMVTVEGRMSDPHTTEKNGHTFPTTVGITVTLQDSQAQAIVAVSVESMADMLTPEVRQWALRRTVRASIDKLLTERYLQP